MVDAITMVNLDTGARVLMDKHPTEGYWLESVAFGTVPATINTVKAIEQIGVYVPSITLEPREPTITGWVVASNYVRLEQLKDVLNRAVNPLQDVRIECYGSYRLDGHPQTSIAYSVPWQENNDVMCKFVIHMYCQDPCFYDSTLRQQIIANWQGMFHFPLIIPDYDPVGVHTQPEDGIQFGHREPSLVGFVDNPGVVDVGMVCEFTAEGALTNPWLMNLVTRETFKVTYPMAYGDKIVVDTRFNEKGVTFHEGGADEGIDIFNYFNYPESMFFQLHVGSNMLRYGADSNDQNLQVSITYYPRFLEVE